VAVAEELLAAQETFFATIDPILPAPAPPPSGEIITAGLPDGNRIAGVLTRHRFAEGSLATLWSATEVWELTPVVGGHGHTAIAALLTAWRRWQTKVGEPGADSSCLVQWPSRDAASARPLLDHGFVPLSVIAVRLGGLAANSRLGTGVRIRRAVLADLDALLELAMAELAYSALVGAAVPRRGAETMKRTVLELAIRRDEPVWLAERDGMPIALADCRWSEATLGSWTATRLPPGRWGLINSLSVRPDARGNGLGQQLMSFVHAEFAAGGAVGTYLHYNPPNPLSSVFWPRQGYRPLWTQWEVRPAAALR
jgi:GNAT superfamily N-acetyltransferase